MLYALGVLIVGVTALMLLPAGWSRRLDGGERRALQWFLAVRSIAPLAYAYVIDRADQFFSGGADSQAYVNIGRQVASQLQLQGYSQIHREVPGTGSVDLIVGHLFRVAGPSQMAANYLMTGMSSIGIILFWLSTRTLISNERLRVRYGYFLLLAPTTAYWSASVSKEAPILLGIGCATAAFQQIIDRRARLSLRTILLLVTATLLLGFVRPHVAVMITLAFVAGALFSSGRLTLRPTPQRRILLAMVALGGLAVAVPLSEELLNVGDGETLVDRVYDRTEQDTSDYGRSAYVAEPVRNVFDIPRAMVEVILRPFPWEIRTPFQALASMETLLYAAMLGYAIVGAGYMRAKVLRHPSLIFALSYIALMSSALVTYGNLGLLIRQRMQFWMHLVLITFLFLETRASWAARKESRVDYSTSTRR